MSKELNYASADGALGTIRDVTDEHYYKDPRIELYDGLEHDCYKLICGFAQLIGVNLDSNEVDYSLANSVRDNIINLLEKQFKMPFPLYGENDVERAERIARAKEAFAELEAEFGDVPSLEEQIADAEQVKTFDPSTKKEIDMGVRDFESTDRDGRR